MPELYEDILKKMNKAQELLDKSRKNLSEIKNFVYEEMIHEPKLAVKKLYSDLYRKVCLL